MKTHFFLWYMLWLAANVHENIKHKNWINVFMHCSFKLQTNNMGNMRTFRGFNLINLQFMIHENITYKFHELSTDEKFVNFLHNCGLWNPLKKDYETNINFMISSLEVWLWI